MSSAPSIPFRVGHGWDLHRLEPHPPEGRGRTLVLGGIAFDHPVGPVSHSDGDAVYHAVTDALLGALRLPDIGQLFPDNDPRWDGQDSSVFLKEAAARLRALEFRVVNMDVTIICERPKIGPVKEQIARNLAACIDCDVAAVNVKGKTHERVDAVGEGRAVEVHAVVLLSRV